MRNDVKTLIEALTTERNSIDRAIGALMKMSDMKTEAPAPVVKRTKTRHTRTPLTLDQKADIANAMSQCAPGRGQLFAAAKVLARRHGCSPATIYTGWKKWVGFEAPVVDAASPEANGNLVGVQ